MTEKNQFPFRLNNAFFTSLRFSRAAKLPEPIEVGVEVEFKILDEGLPNRLQINLKVRTLDESPVAFSLELVSLFDLIEGGGEPDPDTVHYFLTERAFFILWPQIVQVVKLVTGLMGMNPLNLIMPPKLELPPPGTARAIENEQ